ncbi:(2Fe-2S) ferredoxin domain-containing protein [Paenibacillus apiarius]|uniref:(2Fe-2S) ferredoxin domain-containing protein n=1 Tax=Paenibacillus apiarius TaxID=46240 RepID=A0ABT4DQP2_9BACL|nr:(2Fe-2S) ferredoxin domain-containing protein [Paenibacillus apiarius]MCY9513360.1 (2Fe-2S) ferredoxin domain-containing protein [Paenibacillus apiarius]MCY9519668.1 (2Fe-2S) ferredoxin domain-containing protein [Paenibacillus apiarius]MCY9553276.1 (2Fe-2S) ferredoxin domain-containing protein [Paenibacillus apiarius]MCY9557126.1 (2Fe-2S) ferredoxin domain-containing protein [Paenibacillus apiarius]MCY9682133.1 (2Fe-2S) ferredoxin domain-containing protein [Paenibacillus apiarius]
MSHKLPVLPSMVHSVFIYYGKNGSSRRSSQQVKHALIQEAYKLGCIHEVRVQAIPCSRTNIQGCAVRIEPEGAFYHQVTPETAIEILQRLMAGRSSERAEDDEDEFPCPPVILDFWDFSSTLALLLRYWNK